MKNELQRTDLVYPELSFGIVGVLYDVYNKLGYGHQEKTYQRAVALALAGKHIVFQEQLFVPVFYEQHKIGNQYFDFLIEGKLVLEIKKGDHFSKSHIDQVYQYLVSSKLQLGILAYFAPQNVHYKRIVNIPNSYIRKH